MAGMTRKPPTEIARKAASLKAYGAQAAKQPGWGGMGATKPKGPVRKAAPKRK